ncbi:hypothetical protein ACQKH5_07205 [Hyphomonas sp. NPDC076900]|uniref:hypothetical protein n=1 Tax=Hyphomonas sp. NPDC076900 TaxID=3390570 RepID=UPI003D0649F4
MARRKRVKAPKAKQFVGARLALWLATVTLAVFGAVGWGLALWEVSPPLAILGGLVALVAPLVAAALAGPATHGAGFTAWLCILIFTAMDAGSNANAAWQFDAAANREVNSAAISSHADAVAKAKAARDAAQAALLALPTPDANGAIRKADTYATTHAALTANLMSAQGHLDAIVKPEPTRLFPKWLSGVVMALTSIGLILGHLAVNTASRKSAERLAREATKPTPRQTKRKPSKPRPVPIHGDNVVRGDFGKPK